jgi:hypothetical protein
LPTNKTDMSVYTISMKRITKMNQENTYEVETDPLNCGAAENFVGTEVVLLRLVGYMTNQEEYTI